MVGRNLVAVDLLWCRLGRHCHPLVLGDELRALRRLSLLGGLGGFILLERQRRGSLAWRLEQFVPLVV